jgi:uncharacterized protein with PIN domain
VTAAFDASGVVCWLSGEPGAERAEQLLADPESQATIHAVNFAEVCYVLLRRNPGHYQRAVDLLMGTGIGISRDMGDVLLNEVARLKANFAPIALGDAFAVANAVVTGATLITTDRSELEKVAEAGICAVEFLR